MSTHVQWTDPKTWVVGAKVRAADLNAHMRDNLLFLYGAPRVAAFRTTDKIIPSGDHVVVDFDEVVRDVGNWTDPGSPEAFVVPRTGEYLVHFPHLWAASNDDGDRHGRLLRDTGTGYIPLRGDRVPATLRVERSTMWMTDLAEGWSLAVDVRQTSGADLALESRGGPRRSPLFIARWI